MSRLRSALTTAATATFLAAALVACGGGDDDKSTLPGSGAPSGAPTTKGTFTSLVTFGDSLSDVGTYAPATSLTGNGAAPYFGGKFTVNGPGGTVWVENLATTLGITTTAAEVGFAGTSQKCPAALQSAALANTCTSYGQGGSRVTDPNGIGRAGGALTVPVRTQIQNHIARFGGFKASDLVIVWAGNNDAFAQFGAFSAAATRIQTDAAAGRIPPAEVNPQLLAAQVAAQEEMKKAALELAGYVKEQIVGRGAQYVAVANLPDSTLTPFGGTLPGSARPVLTSLVDTFNFWLREGLNDVPVRIIDQNTAGKDVWANPGKYGITVNNAPACDAAKIAAVTGNAVTDGSSLFCNGTPGAPFNGLRTGASTTTWQFADGVHPTPGGHKVISDYVAEQLRAFGWI